VGNVDLMYISVGTLKVCITTVLRSRKNRLFDKKISRSYRKSFLRDRMVVFEF